MKSRYLSQFQRLQSEASDSFELIGDVILVERIGEEEVKTAGGLILPTSHNSGIRQNGFGENRPNFYHVLLVGQGYFDDSDTENEIPIPLNVEPGDIVMLGTQSVRELSSFGPIIASKEAPLGYTREGEVHLRFKGQAGYEKVCALLAAGGY